MAVSSTLTIPGAGATFVPLGGDGFSAPFALNLVDVDLAGAAGGGAATFTVNLDPRYCSSVTLVGIAVAGVNADVQYRIAFSANPAGTSLRHAVTGTLVGVASTVSSEGAAGYWIPPATVLPPGSSFSIKCTNVDGDTFRFSAEILLWNIRVRELSPWPYLMGAHGSGGQSGPNI